MKIIKRLIHIAVYILIFFIIYYLGCRFSSQIINGFESFSFWLYPNNPDNKGELLKITLSVLGAFGFLYGLYISLRRAKAIEQGVLKQNEALNLQSKQIELTRTSQISERFKNAIEHLGSEKEPIIIGGVSELHQIAKENKKEYSEIIFNILTGYLRTNSVKNKNVNIIQTIIDFIFTINENRPYNGYIANLSRCDLIGINLSNKDLSSIDLSHSKISSLINCNIENANLNRTHFFCAKISNTNFTKVKLRKTIFYLSTIEYSSFKNLEEYTNCQFKDSTLRKINFEKLYMTDWKFIACNFHDINFKETDIISSHFCGSFIYDSKFDTNNLFNKNDFRACLLNNVEFKDTYIIEANFRGSISQHHFDSAYLIKPENYSSMPGDISSIKLNNSFLNRTDTSSLNNEDILEINKMNKKIEDIIHAKEK